MYHSNQYQVYGSALLSFERAVKQNTQPTMNPVSQTQISDSSIHIQRWKSHLHSAAFGLDRGTIVVWLQVTSPYQNPECFFCWVQPVSCFKFCVENIENMAFGITSWGFQMPKKVTSGWSDLTWLWKTQLKTKQLLYHMDRLTIRYNLEHISRWVFFVFWLPYWLAFFWFHLNHLRCFPLHPRDLSAFSSACQMQWSPHFLLIPLANETFA